MTRRSAVGGSLAVALSILVCAAAPAGGQDSKPKSEPAPSESLLEQEARIELEGGVPAWAPLRTTLVALRSEVEMPFPNETPLEDVLKYIKTVTVSPACPGGLPIYIDPAGRRGAGKEPASMVKLEAAGLPLATSMTRMLRQVGLVAYVQKDGVVIVTGPGRVPKGDRNRPVAGVESPLEPVRKGFRPAEPVRLSPKAAPTWDRLRAPIAMPFADPTPLEDALKYIKSATVAPKLPEGLPIVIDPKGLPAPKLTEQSPVTLHLEGVPLETTLMLLLRQLGLTYVVGEDGSVTIRAAAGDRP
jgi:hypothetical protein